MCGIYITNIDRGRQEVENKLDCGYVPSPDSIKDVYKLTTE